MIHRNRCNRRYVRRKHIKRRSDISKSVSCCPSNKCVGKYAKGKVHCSCGLCSEKSTKISVNGHSYPCNSRNLYKRRDRRELERIDYNVKTGMKEYPMPVATSGDDDMDSYICPSCKNELAPVDDDFIFYMSPEELENSALCYCGHCGQKLDWSKHIKNSEK